MALVAPGVPTRALTILLVVAALVRLPLLLVPGYEYDMWIFREWTAAIVEDGLIPAMHRPDMNYIGYAYVLGAIGWLRAALASVSLEQDVVLLQLMKVPGVLGDLGVAVLLYHLPAQLLPVVLAPGAPDPRPRWFRSIPLPRQLAILPADRQIGLLAAALYLFNPATLYTSGYWGQIDSLIALAMLGCVYALLRGHPGVAGFVLATGFLLKPQPIVLVPLLGWLAWRWFDWGGVARAAGGGVFALATGLGYFAVHGELGRIRAIYDILFETGEQISVSAMNLWWIVYRVFGDVRLGDVLTSIGPIEVTPARLSQLFLATAVALLVAALGWRPSRIGACLGAAFLVLCFYLLPMKMHERYLFPLFALLAPIAAIHVRWLAVYVLLSITYTLNLYALLPIPMQPDQTSWAFGAPLDVLVSVANMTLLVVFLGLMLAERRVAREATARSSRPRDLDVTVPPGSHAA